MSSQYPNEGSSPPPGNGLPQYSVGFEVLTEIDVNDYLNNDGGFGQELMGNQDAGSIQQPLLTNPSLDFGSDDFPVLDSFTGYHPMPNQTSSTPFEGSWSCPNNFPPQNSLSGQLLFDQPSNDNHGYGGSSYFPDSLSTQNPLPYQLSTANLESSFSVQNSFPGHHPSTDQSSTANVGSANCPDSFSAQNPLPNQSSTANVDSSFPVQNSFPVHLGNFYCPDSFSKQNPLPGQHPLPGQPSTANVESSFSVQNFPGHHPLPDQSSTEDVGNSYYPDSFLAQNSLLRQHSHSLPNQPPTANVGSSYCPDNFSAQNSLSGQHPLPSQPPITNVGSSYFPDSFSARNSLPGQLSLPNHLSTTNVGSSYCPDSFSAQNSLPKQLSLPNQASTVNAENSFSVQNSLPGGYHSLPNESPAPNAGNSHCLNIISVQSSLRRQLPLPNQPLVANRFSGQDSLPGQPQLNQPSNSANPGNSYYCQNSFSRLNSLPGQIPPHLQSSIANLRSSVPIRSAGQVMSNLVRSYTANVGSSSSNNFSAVQNTSPRQNLPNQTSTASLRSSGANNFSAGQNLPNQTSTANMRSSGANNISAVQNLRNQTSTANIRSSGTNNVSAVQNLFPGRGRGRRGRPPGSRNSRGRGRSSTGENNFQLLNFSPAPNHPPSNRTTSTENVRSSNQNNVLVDNVLQIQQQQQPPPNSGANTGNSSNLNHYHHHAGNILQGSENPNNFIQQQDMASENNIQPNNPLIVSNNFPIPAVPGQDDLPGGEITGAGNNNIQDELARDLNPLQQELVVVPPAADKNQTSGGTGNNVQGTLDSIVAESLNYLATTEQPTAGDQNNNALQENVPIQIVVGGNHDTNNNNNNNNNNNARVDHEGPELPTVEEINSARKPEGLEEKDPPLADGLSWLYTVKPPVKKRGDLNENCTASFKRFCKSNWARLYRSKKCPGVAAGETNGSAGGLTSGAPDEGKVPNNQGTADGTTISPSPPPPPELVVNSSVNPEAAPVVDDTVATETAVLPLASSSADVDNNVNSVASPGEMMEMETNDDSVIVDNQENLTAAEPDEKWSEEFDMLIGV